MVKLHVQGESARRRHQPQVLHVRVVANAGGGPDKTVLRSAAWADPLEVRMAAAYLYPKHHEGIEVIREQAAANGCELYEIPEAGPLDPWAIRALLQVCRKLRVDVWHAHDYKSDALGLLLKRLHNMKLVTTVHGWTRETSRTRLYYHVDNWCIPRYDQVVAVSPKLTEQCRKIGVPADRLRYIPNGIDPGEYAREHTIAEARRELGIGADRLVIGVVGRLSSEKGVDRAVRLVSNVAREHPSVKLLVVGDGPERGTLEAMARSCGVSERVRFEGWQASPRRFYEAMDLLLLPSHTEGLPNAVLEAMAMGVAVAATDVGGVRELLDEGAAGVVLPQLAATWPALLDGVLSDAELRISLAQRGRLRIEQHYSFASRMARMGEVYDLALGRTPDRIRRAA